MSLLSLISNASRRIPLTYTSMLLKSIGEGSDSTVIDVGCGKGGIMAMIDKDKKFISIGLDVFEDYLTECKKNKTHTELVRCDIRHLPFKDNAIELALCCEVIEHIQKDEGVTLLEELERVTSKKIVVTTPVGFKEESELEDNAFQRHVSGWLPREFKDRGYVVRGQGTQLSGEDIYRLGNVTNRTLSAEEKHQSASAHTMLVTSILINLVFFPARLLVYFRPSIASHMFCTKTK